MMCKLDHQAPKKTQSGYQSWRKYPQIVVKISQLVALGILVGTVNVLVTEKVIAQEARTTKDIARVNLAVNRQSDETYESLLTRAESVAMSALKQRFHQDKHTPAVSVIIVGHNQGAIAPVLSVEVNRNQWGKAQTKAQMKFFATSRQLLGFDSTANTSSSSANPELVESESINNDDIDIEMPDASSASDEIPEIDDVQAPAIVPVDTPTPEVPGVVPINTSTTDADTTEFAPVLPASNSNVDANAVPPQPTTNNLNPQPPTPNNLTPDSVPEPSGAIMNDSPTTPTTP